MSTVTFLPGSRSGETHHLRISRELRQCHLAGKHNQKTHGGNSAHVPDIGDTVSYTNWQGKPRTSVAVAFLPAGNVRTGQHDGFVLANKDAVYVENVTVVKKHGGTIEQALEDVQKKPEKVSSAAASKFPDVKDADMNKATATFDKSLSAKDRSTILGYVGNDLSFDINQGLRAKKLDPKFKSYVAAFDKIIDRSSVPMALTSYRVVLGDFGTELAGRVGKTVRDLGYASTTISKSYAHEFENMSNFEGKTSTRIEVRVPKGAKGLFISSRLRDRGSENEHELLLPRSSKFRVVSVNESPDSGFDRHVVVEVIP